jgi:hypothetical protein
MFAKVKFLVAAGLALAVSTSYAQNPSTAATVTLNAVLAESLTVVPSVANLNVPLTVGAVSAPAGPFNVKTSWVLAANRGTVTVLGYLTSATAALSDGSGNNIPASAVLGKVNSGTYAAFTSGADHGIGLAAASLPLGTTAITNANRNSNRTDTLALEIDLSTGSLPQLPAATYTGTLNLQAVAY